MGKPSKEMYQVIVECCIKGYVDSLNKILNEYKDINLNETNTDFSEPFIITAAKSGQLDIIKCLYDRCAQLSTKAGMTQTLLEHIVADNNFQLLEQLADLKICKINLGSQFKQKDSTTDVISLATILAKERQFPLLRKIRVMNADEIVELNNTTTNKLELGLGMYLLMDDQKGLFLSFLSAQPEGYHFNVDRYCQTSDGKRIHVAWFMSYNQPNILKTLVTHARSHAIFDLTIRNKDAGNISIEEVLNEKDPGLLKLIKKSQEAEQEIQNLTAEKERLLSIIIKEKKKDLKNGKPNFISVHNKVKDMQLDREREALQSKQETPLEKFIARFVEKDIIVTATSIVEKNQKKLQLSISGNNRKGLEELNKIVKKYLTAKDVTKSFDNKTLIISAKEETLKTFFVNNAAMSEVKKIISIRKPIETATPPAGPNTTDKTETDGATSQTQTTPGQKEEAESLTKQTVILTNEQKMKWIEQLEVAFCHAASSISWNDDKGAFVVTLRDVNTLWPARGTKNQHPRTIQQGNKIHTIIDGYKVTDEFIATSIIKPLKKYLESAATVTDNVSTKTTEIYPLTSVAPELKTLRTSNFTHIQKQCICHPIIIDSQDLQEQKNNTQVLKQHSEKQEVASVDVPLESSVIRNAMTNFLSAIYNNLSRDQYDTCDFKFLEIGTKNTTTEVKTKRGMERKEKISESKNYCLLTFSLQKIHHIGVLDSLTFMTIIMNTVNEVRPNTMIWDMQKLPTFVIKVARAIDTNKLFNETLIKIISNSLLDLQHNEEARRLELVRKLPDVVIANNINPRIQNHRAKADLTTAMSKIVSKDFEVLNEHLIALAKIDPITSEQSKLPDEQNEIDYHLYLFHTLQVTRLLASKINDDGNVFWALRNVIRHAYETLDWKSFYLKINPLIKILNAEFSHATLQSGPTFFTPNNINSKALHGLEDLIHKYQFELDNKILGKEPNRNRLDLNSLQTVINTLHENSTYSDVDKRDCTTMIYSLVGERVKQGPYFRAFQIMGHELVREYSEHADHFYQGLLAKAQKSNAKKFQ